MSTEGRVVFGKMDEVVFGKPAADSIAEQTHRLGAERVFLMVSGTLNRETGEIASIRAALGNRCSGLFDKMPPHTPRSAVIAAAAMAREDWPSIGSTMARRPSAKPTERSACLALPMGWPSCWPRALAAALIPLVRFRSPGAPAQPLSGGSPA